LTKDIPSAQLLVSSERDYKIDLFGPVALNVGWQAKAGLGFDLSHFQIDWQQKAAYCPQGKRSYLWKNNKDVYGKPVIYTIFKKSCTSKEG
jgi:transposase